jgi:hypothetical protein
MTRHSLTFAKERSGWDFNHDFLRGNDRAEVIAAWERVKPSYPGRPAFRDFLPQAGNLPGYLRTYLDGFVDHARAVGKRPVFCEVYSRGRAGALRTSYGGYHIAQFRDPLSQFGSFYRALEEGGLWFFLCDPIIEIGVNGNEPLFSLIPTAWRPPIYSWPAGRSADAWLSNIKYRLEVASASPDSIARAFRTHLLSWFLTNLVAVCYSDLVLDTDKLHDDPPYRAEFAAALDAEVGESLDFRGVTKYPRYFQFEGFDMVDICNAVSQWVSAALESGQLEIAVRGLGRSAPIGSVRGAVELLRTKLNTSIANLKSYPAVNHVTDLNWRETVAANRLAWENRYLREFLGLLYPAAAPIVHAIRRTRSRRWARDSWKPRRME